MRRLALAAALCLAALGARAEGSVRELLRAEFWTDLEPVAAVGEEWPVSEATARARVLAEAAWVFGGIIWGFEYRYSPSDKARGIAERFEIESLGSPAPELLSLAPERRGADAGGASRADDPLLRGDAYRASVEFRPDAPLAALEEAHSRSPWAGCQGVGRADMVLGVKGRRAAYEDALRAALRSYLQSLMPNKPRLVRGRIALERPPSLAIMGGYYTVQLRARATVTEAIPYKVY